MSTTDHVLRATAETASCDRPDDRDHGSIPGPGGSRPVDRGGRASGRDLGGRLPRQPPGPPGSGTGQVRRRRCLRPGGLGCRMACGRGQCRRVGEDLSATAKIDVRLPDAIAYAVAPEALWYVSCSDLEAAAVEVDPATGAELRVSPCLPRQGHQHRCGGKPVDLRARASPHHRGQGRHPTGMAGAPRAPLRGDRRPGPDRDIVWALPAPEPRGAPGSSNWRPGPTGAWSPSLTASTPTAPVAFGSIWIPWDNHGALYRYPVDAFAR